MYGFFVSKKGIITDNYYKNLGYYEEPEPQGVYVLLRRIGDEIRINQDYSGSYGIYIYENKNKSNFIFSNSFLLLGEYLVGKHNFTINKDFADTLIISGICSPSVDETMINEIKILPQNAFIIINIKKRIYKLYYIDYKEKTIPLESPEGMKIIDNWMDKWGYIIRSLLRKTKYITSDLSGGFDSRLVLSILINSGINIKKILINSIVGWKGHEEDLEIATKISKKLGFKLNNLVFDNKGKEIKISDAFHYSMYAKLGFTNWFRSPKNFLNKPQFDFVGYGGENLRGYPRVTAKEYMEKTSRGYNKNFYNSSIRIFNRSISFLKKQKTYYNDYELSADLYLKGRTKYHFGKTAMEVFLSNEYIIYPLLDPDINQIKYNICQNSTLDLISYIFVRYGQNLINFPFQGKRELSKQSLKKAEQLNGKYEQYKSKLDYNKNFFIDDKRSIIINSESSSKKEVNINKYIEEIFNSTKIKKNIHKFYDRDVYNKAINVSEKTKSIIYKSSLLAVSKIIEIYLNNQNYYNKTPIYKL